MNKQISNNVLMTAAGFTRNFGGFLAEDMRDYIRYHTEVKNRPVLRSLLDTDFDYESVYHEVCTGDYKDDDREAINIAIFEAYSRLDDIAQNYNASNAPESAILYGAKNIINRLTCDKRQINFFFTLNQDLFVERLMPFTEKPITSPGISRRIVSPGLMNSKRPLEIDAFIEAPARDELDTTKDITTLSSLECHYIKLHGSFGWKSSDPDRSNMLVIGRNKEDQMANEPLLIWYFDLFKQVLFQGGIKLLIIGYGFRDKHINKIIAEAIERHNLKLYIISPSKSEEFKEKLIRADSTHGEQIFSSLANYFKASLGDIFPPNGSDSHKWKELNSTYFAD